MGTILFVLFVPLLQSNAATITVKGSTDADIQKAIDAAYPGDRIFLPAGTYNFHSTVNVNKSLTLEGAAKLQNLSVVEYGPKSDLNVSPVWSGDPSECYADTSNLELFRVSAHDVTFRNLKIRGRTTEKSGSNNGIRIFGYNNMTVIGCETTACSYSIYYQNSLNGLVRDCYIHDNCRNGLGYGVAVTGQNMVTGGSQVMIRNNEFMNNRHDVPTNSPLTSIYVYKNYTHDDFESQHQVCFESHPQGGYTLRAVVRDNIFVRTRPLGFRTGSVEITGNFYDETCGYTDRAAGGWGSGNMCPFGIPEHNGVYIPACEAHDIYIGGNINKTGKPEANVVNYPYDGVRKYVTYNFYLNGALWEAEHTDYPPLKTDPRPLLGDIYLTAAGGENRLESIKKNTWYDLHVLACDPQGADNIASIGVQLRDPSKYSYIPGNESGEFRADGDYFIETDGKTVSVRKKEGSADWSPVKNAARDVFVDTNGFKFFSDGSHRKHLIISFRVLSKANAGEWIMAGYVRDADGNIPHKQAYETHEGWFLTVEK